MNGVEQPNVLGTERDVSDIFGDMWRTRDVAQCLQAVGI
jgi:hypothetical protein